MGVSEWVEKLGRGGGWTYCVVVAEANVAVDVDAALAGLADCRDEWLSVEGRRLDKDTLFGMAEGG